MATAEPELQAEILRRLLEAHERSISFGKAAPWPRDVILAIDAKTFPLAFGPDGREVLELMRKVLVELEGRGACRVVYERAQADALPRQLRLGPAEVATAYAVAAEHGIVPLAEAIALVRREIESLLQTPGSEWARDYLLQVGAGLASVDLAPLGMGRERFKRLHRDVADALRAANAISAGVDAWERMLSERIFGRAERLAEIRGLVANLLVRADPSWLGLEIDDALDVLELYGVRRKPGVLRCAGAGALHIGDREYRLEDFTPTAALPEAWAAAWCQAAADARVTCITTIENEHAFLAYVDEVGGAEGLRARSELVVHVAGFPGPWLTRLLRETAIATGARLRHWGDADVGGLLIWRVLRARVDRPIEIFRTTPAWIRDQARAGGQPLTARERAALHRLQEAFAHETAADYQEAHAVASALLDTNVKLEQDRS
jgi:hypothetical protein